MKWLYVVSGITILHPATYLTASQAYITAMGQSRYSTNVEARILFYPTRVLSHLTALPS